MRRDEIPLRRDEIPLRNALSQDLFESLSQMYLVENHWQTLTGRTSASII